MSYRDVYNGWKADPEGFWMQAAEAIDWDQKPSKALDDSRAPLYEWFTDGMVNTCWNAIDRHGGSRAIRNRPAYAARPGVTHRRRTGRLQHSYAIERHRSPRSIARTHAKRE